MTSVKRDQAPPTVRCRRAPRIPRRSARHARRRRPLPPGAADSSAAQSIADQTFAISGAEGKRTARGGRQLRAVMAVAQSLDTLQETPCALDV
ncbi:hypothetical protein Acel_1544 [Acidothermus cellulolyticus 11B]|uniref:Uncharacterized protein n=1 Tax=Acidothermus cellulolyticus (strain ATCC 43068 / DSM 8971 / 11B) TaxID=351607 RepID=A0LV56_ACIC1|nr:hypothetical protein Acel_1544 [Acidothermus cellulolyticus 11B]